MSEKFLSLKILIAILLLASGCKKEKDEVEPEVIINTPVENQTFNVYDVINVTASISDQYSITEVNVSLVDINLVQKHTLIQLEVPSNSFNIDCDYELNNIHLTTGTYYLMVAASDGKNIKKAYRMIYIQEVPREIKKIIVCTQGSGQVNLSAVDSTFSFLQALYSFNGDFLASSVSNYYQRAFIAGYYNGSFQGFSFETNTPVFTIPFTSSSNPYFTGFYSDEQKTYVARYDGMIKGYTNQGALVYGANSSSGYYSENIFFLDDNLIAEQKYYISNNRILVAYHPGGAPMHQVPLSYDIISFCRIDGDQVLLFGNAGGQGQIQIYDPNANYLWNPYPYTLPAGTVLNAIAVDEDTFIFAHSNQTIYKYEYTSSSITPLISGYAAKKLILDPINNVLFVAEANSISTFSYPAMTPLQTLMSAETVLDFNLLYNR